MTERNRLRLFFVAAVIFFCLYVSAAHNMPAWGDYRGPYGDVIARVAVYERHATDVINAINYDYRGFDTLGEEFILFAAGVGCFAANRAGANRRKILKRFRMRQGSAAPSGHSPFPPSRSPPCLAFTSDCMGN